MFCKRIRGSWTSTGKGAFSVGWQFIARDVELVTSCRAQVTTSFDFEKGPAQIG